MQHREQPSNLDLHELLHRLHDRITEVERRLVAHYTEEHKSFDAALEATQDALNEVRRLNDWIRGGKVAARIIIGLAAFVAALAAAYAWVRTNFHISARP